MTSTLTTFNDIASILSFSTNELELKKAIEQEKIDWDNIVKISSEHLVLPTVFCRLKQKKLDHLIPKELFNYLNELTNINRNRNNTLIKEATEINELFKEHHINHVFLKGIALITGNFYTDFGERMITDIDILVDLKGIKIATELLIDKGYLPNKETIGDRHLNKRHTPRLINKNKLAAVELHTSLLNKSQSHLINPNEILKGQEANVISVPSILHLLKHNILNFQINDKGSYYNDFGFRSAYDSLILINQMDKPLNQNLLNETVFIKYMAILTLYFAEVKTQNFDLKYKFLQKTHHFKLRNPKLKMLWYKFLYYTHYTQLLINRLNLFIRNKDYRKEIIKSI